MCFDEISSDHYLLTISHFLLRFQVSGHFGTCYFKRSLAIKTVNLLSSILWWSWGSKAIFRIFNQKLYRTWSRQNAPLWCGLAGHQVNRVPFPKLYNWAIVALPWPGSALPMSWMECRAQKRRPWRPTEFLLRIHWSFLFGCCMELFSKDNTFIIGH